MARTIIKQKSKPTAEMRRKASKDRKFKQQILETERLSYNTDASFTDRQILMFRKWDKDHASHLKMRLQRLREAVIDKLAVEPDMDAQTLQRHHEREAFEQLRELEDTSPRSWSGESPRFTLSAITRAPQVADEKQAPATPVRPSRGVFATKHRKRVRAERTPATTKPVVTTYKVNTSLPPHLRDPECIERRR